jgi:hypothetical protein
MISQRLAGITILILILFLGCAGDYANLRNLSESESKAIQQELIDNWSDYDIWLGYGGVYNPSWIVAIIFLSKIDNMELMLEGPGNQVKVKDQDMWTEVLKENTTSDGELTLVRRVGGRSSTRVQEIWGPDSQLYGFIVYQEWTTEVDRVELVDDNTLRLWYKHYYLGGGRGGR